MKCLGERSVFVCACIDPFFIICLPYFVSLLCLYCTCMLSWRCMFGLTLLPACFLHSAHKLEPLKISTRISLDFTMWLEIAINLFITKMCVGKTNMIWVSLYANLQQHFEVAVLKVPREVSFNVYTNTQWTYHLSFICGLKHFVKMLLKIPHKVLFIFQHTKMD